VPGRDFFKAPEPQVLARTGNSATGAPWVDRRILIRLTSEDYRLRFNGTDWELRRASNSQPVGDWASVGLAIDVGTSVVRPLETAS
jgi:flagellar hook-associated protein 1